MTREEFSNKLRELIQSSGSNVPHSTEDAGSSEDVVTATISFPLRSYRRSENADESPSPTPEPIHEPFPADPSDEA